MTKFNQDMLDKLSQAFASISSKEDCSAFLADICSVKELIDLSQRLEVAKMLSEGSNYNDIIKKTGASSATISRVNRSLEYGNGGYKTVLEKMSPKDNDNEKQ